jgi:hypothetical protein
LTKGKFLATIKKGLQQSGDTGGHITGKSFRSGIASELENFPKTFKERHIKILGRWKSNSYQRYIRKFRKEKKLVMKEIADTLLSKFSSQASRRGGKSTD